MANKFKNYLIIAADLNWEDQEQEVKSIAHEGYTLNDMKIISSDQYLIDAEDSGYDIDINDVDDIIRFRRDVAVYNEKKGLIAKFCD